MPHAFPLCDAAGIAPPQQAEQAVVFYYTQNGFVILWPSTVLQFCVSPSPCALILHGAIVLYKNVANIVTTISFLMFSDDGKINKD